jgi:hypothetical protein
MKLENARKTQRGVTLIVIVAVLAVLSLLAATFGMVARVELGVSRNQTEYEMAREAAHSGVEALLNNLQSWLNGGSMTSGALPTFLPNSADTDGVLQYKRDGVKVYFAASDTVPAGSLTPDWLQGLGLQDAGMFNINAMGFANDLGSNCNPDIRYTSFDCSLVRLLTSRFATISTAFINATDWSTLQSYDTNLGATSQASINELQRLAILLSRAIINWRYGPSPSGYTNPLPGNPGTEERRLGHLPRWNSKLGWTNFDYVGVAYPTPSPPYNPDDTGVGYPPGATGKYDWGLDDGFPSLFINETNVLGTTPWSYFEPGVWSSFLGTGATTPLQLAPSVSAPAYTIPTFPWGNDTGLPFPGLFWGKVLNYSAPTATLTADNSQPGWRDWPAALWNGDYIYFATGPDKWWCAKITSSTATQLTLTNFCPFPQNIPPNTLGSQPNLPFTPNPGDSFCIFAPPPPPTPPATFTPGAYVGFLNQRWVMGDTNPEGDLVPNAMLWPNGTLATEGNVIDLMVDNYLQNANGPLNAVPGIVGNMGYFTTTVTAANPSIVTDVNRNWTPGFFASSANPPVYPFVVHIYAGTGRGQVRTITNNTANTLSVNPPWTAGNLPDTTSQYRIEWNDNNLTSKFQPNNLQGNNRLYLSLGGLRDSVVVPALLADGLSPSAGYSPLTTAGAQTVADILIPYFLPYLTCSTQAIQASQSLCSINDWATDGVDNNANGVVDEPLEAQYEQSPSQPHPNRTDLANSLYNGLGLHTWAHVGAPSVSTTTTTTITRTRVAQAAQLVANIIDFRDPTDVPTKLTLTPTTNDLNEQALFQTPAIVYGAKGLHVTQVMPSPDAVYSGTEPSDPLQPGWEMTSDGQSPPVPNPTQLTDGIDWDFNSGWPQGSCWQVMTRDPTTGQNPVATFTFPNMMPGYYAVRLIGYPPNTVFKVIYNQPWPGGNSNQAYYAAMTTPDPDTTYYTLTGTPPSLTPYWYTGFVRNSAAGGATDGSGVLACFEVVAPNLGQYGSLTFQLQVSQPSNGVGVQFRGFALCAQYIQLTNIATHDINLAGWTVATDQTQPLAPPPPSTQTLPPAITIPATYTTTNNPNYPGPTTIRVDRIHGAAVGAPGTPSSATFPINYGTYVICMCEEAYERQWSARSGPPPDPDYISGNPSPNGDGRWGDAVNEVCTLFPYGDYPTSSTGAPLTGALAQNNATMGLLLGVRTSPTTGYTPAVMVSDPYGNFIAGNQIAAGQSPLGGVDGLIPQIYNPPTSSDPGSLPPTRLNCYSSIEKNVLLQPTWDTSSTSVPYWTLCWNPNTDGNPLPTQLVAYQNVLTTVPADPNGRFTGFFTPPVTQTNIRTSLNRNYSTIWQTARLPTALNQSANPVLNTPTVLAAQNQNRVFPFILNRPYPTTGWLGLVPTSNTDAINGCIGYTDPTHPPGSWRTIDSNTIPPITTGTPPSATIQVSPPATPEQLLGTLMSNATVGGVYARFNINTASEAVLNSVFPSTYLDGGGPGPAPPAPPTISAGPNTLTDTTKNWTASNWPTTPGFTNMVVFIDAGDGQRQVRLITSNTANTLTLSPTPPWNPLLPPPDNTSVYRIMNSQAGLIICARQQRAVGQPPYAAYLGYAGPPPGNFPALANNSWATWDEFLNDPVFQNSPNAYVQNTTPIGIGFYDSPETSTSNPRISNADAGAGTYADGFPDSSNERKEWFMRFSNLFCLQSTSYQFTVAGLVFVDRPWDAVTMQNNEPVAMVRIEADVDLSTGIPSIVHLRYLAQQ